MTLHIRPATRADLPAILAMLAEDTIPADRETDPGDPRYAAAFDAIAADVNQRLVAAERDGGVVGTLQFAFIRGVSVRGAWRGLIEAVRIVEGERGCLTAQLTSSSSRTDAHRFYERLGWAQSHEGFKLKLWETH